MLTDVKLDLQSLPDHKDCSADNSSTAGSRLLPEIEISMDKMQLG